jgi:hypothetical protein
MKHLLLPLLSLMIAASAQSQVKTLPTSPFGVCGLKPRYAQDMPKLWDVVDELGNYMLDAGLTSDRAEIMFGDVATPDGGWDWTFADKAVDVYKKRPISAFCLLLGNAPGRKGPPRTDEERRLYADYVFRIVTRYKDTIKAWEIWNEPNIGNFWDNPSPAEYAALLKAAYAAAKKADPTCTVIACSTSGADTSFIRETMAQGGWDACDAVSIHPYSMAGSPTAQGLPEILRSACQAVTHNGVTKPLWITEIGWTTDTTRQSELAQAEYAVQTYTISLAEGIRYVYWFTLGDWGEKWGLIAGRKNEPDHGYTSTYRGKPALYAIKRLTAALSPNNKRPKFLGWVPLGGEAKAFAFLADGDTTKPVLIAWTPYGVTQQVSLPLALGLKATDAHGKTVTIFQSKMTLTHVPVVITGWPVGNLNKASLKTDPFERTPTTNIVVNPSMEIEDRKDVAFWNRGAFNEGGKEAGIAWAETGRTSKRSLSIGGTAEGAWHSVPIPVRPGRKYTLTAWVKPTGATGENAVRLDWYTGNLWTWIKVDAMDNITGDGDWRQVKLIAQAPANADMVRIGFRGKANTGTVLLDDVTLTEAGN